MRNFNKLEKWVNRNLMKFNKKCKILHLGRNNPRQEYILEVHSAGKQIQMWTLD